ncbi:hypothetical protein J7M23_05410, partial [Candidatus Sumerlaeota bacterium]|nr:hypothetical protein [Candidatus Sumerlaeota bacterium]
MEKLKERFRIDPDEPVIFHRRKLVNKKYPFHILKDSSVEMQFNQELLKCLQKWEYTVITVVIDKLEHKERYKIWRYNPYHYCLAVMLERYVFFLEGLKGSEAKGDVMAESRGGKED